MHGLFEGGYYFASLFVKFSYIQALLLRWELLQACPLFLPLANSLFINSMHPGNPSPTILLGIVNSLQLKRGIKCSLLVYILPFPVLVVTLVSAMFLTILNVIKWRVYSRVATILLHSLLSAASIRWRPLTRVQHLFEVIQCAFFHLKKHAVWILYYYAMSFECSLVSRWCKELYLCNYVSITQRPLLSFAITITYTNISQLQFNSNC